MGGLFGGAKAPQAQKQQPAGALNVQTSIYGSCYPLIYGKNRVPINLIHYVNFKAIAHTETQKTGGKAGSTKTSNTTYTYSVAMAAAFSIGGIKGVGTVWKNKEKHTLTSLGLTLFDGAEGQVAWSYLTASFPSQAVPYANLAYIASPAFDLQDSPSLPNINLEVKGLLPYDEGVIDDAEPSAIIEDYCTNPRHGAGFNYLGDLTLFNNYCRARGIFLSPIENNQRNAGAFIKEIADICNTATVYRNGKLDFIPYGDTEISGNGATYTPDLTPEYDLAGNDFLHEDGQPPVKHASKSPSQQFNHLRLEYNNRANDYNPSVVEVKDQADIDDNGLRTKAVRQCKAVTDADVARDIIQHEMQRDLFVVNTYSFRLGVRHTLLEAMDFVTLTEPGLGLDRQLVRIIEATEQDDAIDIVAEEMNVGVANAPRYDTDGPLGYNQDFNVAPGAAQDPLIVTAPGLLTQTGYETWIAVCGTTPDLWGGCIVWVSDDDAEYRRVGEVMGNARYGAVVNADMPAGTDDYDITSGMRVQLYTGSILAGTDVDCDNWRTLIYVGGEWMSYRDAALVGDTTFDLDVFHRGGYGSVRAEHAIGSAFMRVDEAVFRLPYDVGNRGKTVYFKFQSFNVFGGGMEDLADCTAWPHVLGASELTAPLIGPNLVYELFSNAGVLTIDCSLAEHFKIKLLEDCTVEFINVPLNYVFILDVVQTAAFDLTFPSSVIPVSPVGIVYETTKEIGAVDTLGCLTENVGVTWQMRYSKYVDPNAGGNTNSGSGSQFKVTITPNPGYVYAAANPSTSVSATPENGTTPYSYAWSRAPGGKGDWAGSTGNTGGGDFTISSATVANPTFSRTGTADGFVAQNWRCIVTDGAGKQIQTILEIGLEDDGEYPGTGGGWRCVSVFAWVITQRGEIRAREVVVGDMILCVDPMTGEESWEEVTHSETATVPGLMYQTAAGVTLTCSNTARLPLMDGSTCHAEDIFYQRTYVKRDGRWRWSLVLDVVPLGDIKVQHITCKNKYYLAGDVRGEYCAHHNLKNIPDIDPYLGAWYGV